MTDAEHRDPLDAQGNAAPRGGVGALVSALRTHQWAKNVLVFLPVLLAHKWADLSHVINSLLAFAALCLTASAVYILNDLVDLDADRRHPTKRHRPFASGALPVALGPPVAGLLLLGSGAICLLLPPAFAWSLLAYVGIAVAYSLWLKQKLVIDVLVLAALYSLRIVAGGLVTGIQISEWLLAFSGFLFTSLAFVKRYTELLRFEDDSGFLPGRGYVASDASVIETVGPTSGYLAVLVLALYITSDDVDKLYENKTCLWLVCPTILYWLTRVWFLARRRMLNDDPVAFALTDRGSLLTGLVAVILVLGAALGWGPKF